MSHNKLMKRPSEIIRSFVIQEENEEIALQNKLTRSTPALKKVFQGFGKCQAFLKDPSKREEKHFKDLNALLKVNVMDPFDEFKTGDQRQGMGNNLAKLGFVEAIVAYYEKVQDESGEYGLTIGCMKSKEESIKLLVTIRKILWNFSDSSDNFSSKVARTNMFENLCNDLQAILEEGIDNLESEKDLFAYSSAVGILHNCARNLNIDRDVFRMAGVVECLVPFLLTNYIYVRMVTLLALANVIREDEIDKLGTTTDVIDFFLQAIKTASKNKQRQEHGFHLSELVGGLASLAQTDENKRLIMKKISLTQMRELLLGLDEQEILASVKLVWELSFLEENKNIIANDKEVLSALEVLKKSKMPMVQNAARSAWFVIAGKDKRPDDTRGKHIMISYSWSDWDTVVKIYQSLLSKDYPIWIDKVEMKKFDTLLEGMSSAVEHSYVVLVCFSENYKNSRNCRTEAEYGFKLEKEILPLKLQRGYSPDGWLGALLGTRVFIEFSPQKDFTTQLKTLEEMLPRTPTPDSDPSGRIRPPEGPPKQVVRKVQDWKKPDIDKWAADNKMVGRTYSQVSKMTGEQLQFICQVMNRSPDTFYRWAETKFNLGSVEDLMRFSNAVQGLIPYI